MRRQISTLLLVGLFSSLVVLSVATSGYDEWLEYMKSTSDNSASQPSNAEGSTLTTLDLQPLNVPSDQRYDAWLRTKQLPNFVSHTVFDSHSSYDDNGHLKHDRSSKQVQTIYVAKDGSGDHYTIQSALWSIPQYNSQRKTIFIKAGKYVEKIEIPSTQKYITFVGEGAGKTIISYNATAGDEYGDDEILRTFRSATVGVNSDHFIATNLTFENTAPAPPPGAVLKQAVAFRISGDKAAFYHVSFLGAQDTLYSHRGRHYFRDCFVQGSIDFIFGDGRALFEHSYLHSIASTFGSISAQKRNSTLENTGFSFVNCVVDGTGEVWLGRAWGRFSRVVFAKSYLDKLVRPDGWQNWNDPTREKTVFYGEYQCFGPGAATWGRVPFSHVLSYNEAEPFLYVGFVNGNSWLYDDDSK